MGSLAMRSRQHAATVRSPHLAGKKLDEGRCERSSSCGRSHWSRRHVFVLAVAAALCLSVDLPNAECAANPYQNGYSSTGVLTSFENFYIKRSVSISSIEKDAFGNSEGTAHRFASAPKALRNSRVPSDYLGSSQPLVVFTLRRSSVGERQKTVLDLDRSNVVALHRGEQLELSCRARPLTAAAVVDTVRWWKDGSLIEQSNADILISDTTSNLGSYRCIVEVVEFPHQSSSDYLAGGGSRSIAPSGKVLSGSVVVKRFQQTEFIINPTSTTTAIGSVIRLECAVSGSQTLPIVWRRGNLSLEVFVVHDRFRIYTVEKRSVLHIVGAQVSDSDRYYCESGATRSSIATVAVLLNYKKEKETKKTDKFSLAKWVPAELSLKEGDSELLECLLADASATVTWAAVGLDGHPLLNGRDAVDQNVSRTGIIISGAQWDDTGSYSCYAHVNGSTRKFTTFVLVRTPPILQSTAPLMNITVTQGGTARLHCSATCDSYDSLIEIIWYKDGVEVEQFGRIKLQPEEAFYSEVVEGEYGYHLVEVSRDLLISSAQQSNGGLYQCVITNSAGERSMLYRLIVEAHFDSRITDLKVSADHLNSQFDLEWTLPLNVDYIQAQNSLFLLNYHLSDGGNGNNVPLRSVHCSSENICKAKCCSSHEFLPRRNYTFQMSLLTMDKGGKISPLSDQVSAMSFDEAATKSMDLFVNTWTANVITLSWNQPSTDTANGEVQKYIVEYYTETDRQEDMLPPLQTAVVPATNNTYNITGVQPGLMFRFRVLPVTRNGLPSSNLLKLNPNFTFFARFSTSPSAKYRTDIPAPVFRIKQINDTTMEISWNTSSNRSWYSDQRKRRTVLIKFARSGGHLREKAVEAPYDSRSFLLVDRFDTNQAYQFCAQLFVDVFHSEEYCRVIRIDFNNDIFGHLFSRGPLPKPVRCDNAGGDQSECSCEPSQQFGDTMRVIWKWPANDPGADEFIVHYTIDETDIRQDDRMVITGDSYADVPNLKPNTTYRFMVEARNKAGGVEGFWFSCTTPPLLPIPAPKNVIFTKMNDSMVEVNWTAVAAGPQWSSPVGYIVFIQTSSTSATTATEVLVDGSMNTRYVLQVSAHTLYTVRVAARSNNGEVGARSLPYLLTTSEPDESDGARWAFENARRERPLIPRVYKEAILIAVVAFIGLLTLCFAGIFAHLRLKRKKYQRSLNSARRDATLEGGHRTLEMQELLLADGRNENDHRGMRGEAYTETACSSLLQQSHFGVIENPLHDTKGSEDSELPSSSPSRFLKDEKFLLRCKTAELTIGDANSQLPLQQAVKLEAESEQHVGKPTDGACSEQSNSQRSQAKAGNKVERSPFCNQVAVRTEQNAYKARAKERATCTRRSSTGSSTGDPPAVLNSTLRLSCAPWRKALVYASPPERDHFPSVVKSPPSFIRSNSCQLPATQRRRSECSSHPAAFVSTATESPYSAVSLQSLVVDEEGPRANEWTRATRDIDAAQQHSAAFSSMPNLTDSGIVYDEHHFAHHQCVS